MVMDGEAFGDSTAVITRLAAELGAEQQGVSKAQQSRPSRGFWPFSKQQQQQQRRRKHCRCTGTCNCRA